MDEENKKGDERDNYLDSYLDDFLEFFLDDLESRKVISVSTDKSQGKRYFLEQNPEVTQPREQVPVKENKVIQDFYSFRDVLTNVFNKTKSGDIEDQKATSLSKILLRFIDKKVFAANWKDVSMLRDFLDKADELLVDDEIKSSALKLLEEHRVNFNALTLSVLIFYTKIILSNNFTVEWVEDVTEKDNRVDLIMKVKESNYKWLVDIKFRRTSIPVKELIQQSGAILERQPLDGYRNKVLQVVYTYGNVGDIERSKFRFKEIVQAEGKSLEGLIYYIPIQTASFSNVEAELALLKETDHDEEPLEFIFKNQRNPISPQIDDHFCPEIYNIQSANYEIQVATSEPPLYWRFGLQFSFDGSFPPIEIRHSTNYPVFHLEGNPQELGVKYAFYFKEKADLGQATSLEKFSWERIVMRVFLNNNITEIECLGPDNKPIAPRFQVGHYSYFRVFAWADGRNEFRFDTKIYTIAR